MPLKPGDTLLNGQYQVLRLIAQGGFGSVYQARDTLLERDVAIKELIPALVSDPAWVKRFLREARATLDLRHDHIVATHTLFAESGNHYLVMEYMPGGSLEDRLQQGALLPQDQALRVARQVFEGLAYAHQRGVIHCDLKPANILFAADGTAKVADFGIAHVEDQSTSRSWATSASFVAGTVAYMSPEQTEGKRSDPRTDLYAMGAVLYRMLTGRPYLDFDQAVTPAAVADSINAIRQRDPSPPRTYSAGIAPWLDSLVLRLLAKRPEDRPSTASDVLSQLELPQAPPTTPARQTWPPVSPTADRPSARPARRLRGWAWLSAGTVLLLVTVGIGVALLIYGPDGPRSTPQPTIVAIGAAPTLRPAQTTLPTHTPTLPPASAIVAATSMSTSTPAPTLTPTASSLPPSATPAQTSTYTPTIAPAPTTTPKPTAKPASRIYYASGTSESYRLFVANWDGSGASPLTWFQQGWGFPAWLPDGSRLAFDCEQGLCTIKPDGSGLTQIPAGERLSVAQWSPDGKHIAYTSDKATGDVEIYVMNADGSDVRNITNTHLAADGDPRWSPDGRRILFSRAFENWDKGDICLMNPDGSSLTCLTTDRNHNRGAVWLPSGRIGFGCGWSVCTINPDGSGLAGVQPTQYSDLRAWSPDGKKIAFVSYEGRVWQSFYVANADGTGVTLISSDLRCVKAPRFSPDGRRLAFLAGSGCGNPPWGSALYVANADGSNLKLAIDQAESVLYFTWSAK